MPSTIFILFNIIAVWILPRKYFSYSKVTINFTASLYASVRLRQVARVLWAAFVRSRRPNCFKCLHVSFVAYFWIIIIIISVYCILYLGLARILLLLPGMRFHDPFYLLDFLQTLNHWKVLEYIFLCRCLRNLISDCIFICFGYSLTPALALSISAFHPPSSW